MTLLIILRKYLIKEMKIKNILPRFAKNHFYFFLFSRKFEGLILKGRQSMMIEITPK